MSDGRRRCGAKNRKGGKCQLPALPNGRCKFHGGKTPGGIASVHFKHGLRSKYMPGNLGQRFRAAAADPDLLRLENDVAVLEARLLDLLARADQGNSGIESWERLQALWDHFKREQVADHHQEAAKVLNELGAEIGLGRSDAPVWVEIRDVVEARRKVVDSIRKHQALEHEGLTLDRAMAIFTALSHAVRQNVHDRESLKRISEQFARLMERPESAGALGSSSVLDVEVEEARA